MSTVGGGHITGHFPNFQELGKCLWGTFQGWGVLMEGKVWWEGAGILVEALSTVGRCGYVRWHLGKPQLFFPFLRGLWWSAENRPQGLERRKPLRDLKDQVNLLVGIRCLNFHLSRKERIPSTNVKGFYVFGRQENGEALCWSTVSTGCDSAGICLG